MLFLAFNSCLLAQNKNKDERAPAIYMAGIKDSTTLKDSTVTRYFLFKENGKKIFKRTVDWAYCNTWNWLVVREHDAKHFNIFDENGQPFKELKNISSLKQVSSKESLIGVEREGKFGFYNRQGKKVIDHIYNQVSPFYEEKARVIKGLDTFFIDNKGSRINKSNNLTALENQLYSFVTLMSATANAIFRNDNFFLEESEGKQRLRASGGHLLIDYYYDKIFDLKEYPGLVVVRLGGKFGVVTVRNELVIPIEYDRLYYINRFSNF